ncbi:MAG TPA: hypothetical protein VN803_08050 [Gemmatimonadales bacterium]|nr:hypothetical protein [Gemmatimonadales bacterium]
MMKTICILTLCLIATAQTQPFYVDFGKFTASGTTNGVNLGGSYSNTRAAHKHTLEVVVTGSPAACSIQLEGTLDDVNGTPTWANMSGSQTCTSSVTFHVVDRAVTGVRINLTALSGGSSPTVAVRYAGVQ